MSPTIALTLASLKMFIRNRQALFFSLVIPFVIMGILGVLDLDTFSRIDVGVVDEGQTSQTKAIVEALKNVEALSITQGARNELIGKLNNGRLDFLVIFPEGFGSSSNGSKVEGLIGTKRPQQVQVVTSVLSHILDDLTFDVIGSSRLFQLEIRHVASRSFDYTDFLVPGVIAMSIMQMGLFGVTFSMIRYRQQGVLRRLRAAPVHPCHFLVGQVVTRLIVSVVQTLLLVTAGMLIFGIDMRGSFVTLVLLAILGGGLFISMGYVVSSLAKSEEAAMPIANLIALPMMFLSGVFFSRDSLPSFARKVAEFFPLSFLADGMREVTSEGSGLVEISGDLLGLGVWLVASFIVATWTFRWE